MEAGKNVNFVLSRELAGTASKIRTCFSRT